MGHWRRSGEELLRAVAALETRMRQDYAASLELIAELDARGVAAEVGYPGLAGLLRDVLRINPGEARRRLAHAAALSAVPVVSGGTVPAPLPVTAAALREGAVAADHVDVIAKTLNGLPLHVPDADRATAEQILVQAARGMDARALTKVGHRVRAWLDQDGTPPDPRALADPVNELHLHTRPNGRLVLRGEFDPEASALITTVLSPLARPRPTVDTGPDPRSPAERHGDALVEVIRLVADTGVLPSEGGEKPHLLVTVALDTLRTTINHALPRHTGPPDPRHPNRAGLDSPDPPDATDLRRPGHTVADGVGSIGPVDLRRTHDALLDGVGAIDAESARRIACDARVIPVVLGSRSEPLDLGRASYTVPTALRRLLILRDGGCAFPGCDRSHRWCHCHHIRHWADGGPTEPDNLVLLCGRHHRP